MAESYVKETIKNNPVTLFTKSWCPHCKAVKALFNDIGVSYHDVDIESLPNGSEIQHTLKILTNHSTVPSVWIDDTFIGGNDGIVDTSNINAAVKILVGEMQQPQDVELGPCVEYMLQERMLTHLVNIAHVTEPQGMMEFILGHIINVLTPMKASLIAHSSVYQPIQEIISSWLTEITDKRLLLNLISLMVKKFKDNPFLTRIFIMEEESELPDDIRKCSIFNTLAEMYKDNELRNQVQTIVLRMLQSILDSSVVSAIRGPLFIEVVVADVIDVWKQLPIHIQNNKLDLNNIFSRLDFCNKMMEGNPFIALQELLKKSLEVEFLQKEIAVRLLEGNKYLANSRIVYLRESLLHLGSNAPLSNIIINFLFQDLDFLDSKKNHRIVDSAIHFIYSEKSGAEEEHLASEYLSKNTLRLFSTLLKTGEKFSVIHLFLMTSVINLTGGPIPVKEKEGYDTDLKSYLMKPSRFVDLCQVPNLQETIDYTHAMKIVTQAKKRLNLTSQNVPGNNSENNKSEQGVNFDSNFITVLFRELREFFRHDLEYNLFLTDVVTMVCKWPQEEIFHFLVSSEEKLSVNLYGCLSEIMEITKSQPPEKVKEALDILKEYDPQISHTPDEEHMANCVLFLEFTKEVAATLMVVLEKLHSKVIDTGENL